MTFEQALCAAARPDLMPGVERRLEELRAAGFVIAMSCDKGNWREWTLRLDDRRYVAKITALAHPEMQSAHLVYREAPVKVRRTQTGRPQEAFYARYDGLWDQIRADPTTPIGVDDRRLLLVGDFEADVNNGGFDQYLSNKGLPEARLALAALQAIGAKSTARMLEEALDHPDDEAVLDRLTTTFYDSTEDLAALAAKHAGLGAANRP